MPIKVLCILGTRPEAIKMAPVILGLREQVEFAVKVCVTGQHVEMLRPVLRLFTIVPDYDLNVMTPGQDLYDISAKILSQIKPVLSDARPDVVLVQGDTTSCFIGSLAAFYARIPVGHIEAGLRTYNLYSPFPEEANRALTTRLATYHFAPTDQARANLLSEGIPPQQIWVTGNTSIDALLWMRTRLNQYNLIDWRVELGTAWEVIQSSKPYILITGHRRENFGSGFQQICLAIRQLASSHSDWAFIYPVHLNPNIRQPIHSMLGDVPNVYLLDPVEYAPFVHLMTHCRFILTDSGGIQEEAPSLGKSVLVMRNTTERVEAIESGWARLVGTNAETIIQEVDHLIVQQELTNQCEQRPNPYGDGHAGAKIIQVLAEQFAHCSKQSR